MEDHVLALWLLFEVPWPLWCAGVSGFMPRVGMNSDWSSGPVNKNQRRRVEREVRPTERPRASRRKNIMWWLIITTMTVMSSFKADVPLQRLAEKYLEHFLQYLAFACQVCHRLTVCSGPAQSQNMMAHVEKPLKSFCKITGESLKSALREIINRNIKGINTWY